MRTVQKIAKNTGVIIAGNVIFRLVSLFVIIYLARYLGTEGFGKYVFVLTYLVFFDIITDLGLQQILVREMARDPPTAPKLIGNACIIRLVLTLFAIGLSIVTITLLPCSVDTTRYVYIASFALFFSSFSYFYATIFQANLAMEYNVIAKLTSKLVSAILIFWIIFSYGTLMQIILVFVLTEGIKTILSYSLSRKFIKAQFIIDFKLWKYLLRECLPIALTSVMLILSYQIDVIMLSLMKGDTAVGIYSAAHKLCEPFSLITYALMMSLFPLMSIYFKSSEDKLIKIYTFAFRYLLIIALPIAIGTTLIADKVILLIYDVPFANSATVLQILIWAIMFGIIHPIFSNILVAMDRQHLITISTVLCTVANIILNFILISVMSYNGAAIATVVTTIIFTLSTFYFVSKHLQTVPVHKIVIKPVIAVLVMGVFLLCFNNANLFLSIFFSAIIYLISLLILGVFTKEDLDMLKKILPPS